MSLMKYGTSVLNRFSLVAFALASAGCGSERSSDINIAVAANAVPVVEDIGGSQAENCGAHFVLIQGSSGALAKQALEGAPHDVFVSADVERVEKLAEAGLVARWSVYAEGRLAIVRASHLETPMETQAQVDEALKTAKRIALPNPAHAPYGVAGKEFLKTRGFESEFDDKLVLCESAAQARQYAATGDVDLAFVPASLVVGSPGVWLAPKDSHRPILQAVALMKRAEDNPAAECFYEALLGPVGQEVLLRNGYGIPELPRD
jgi:molybdate transport system substrate-binding protein